MSQQPSGHPTKEIIGEEGEDLEDYNIVLCVTGSVAATKSPEIARKLMRQGAEVRVVMSEEATDLITPELMHWASGNPVVDDLTGEVEHVDLGNWADIVLVAPATANSIGKIANGISDTPPTATVAVALGLEKPIIIVPAMHESMYAQNITENNISDLKEAGLHFLEPNFEEGKAKIPSVERIADFVMGFASPKDLSGRRILVTAGPTHEEIDPVRVLTNKSSGKMGIETARAASLRGAEVTLVYGPGTEAPPQGVDTVRVKTTEEMLEAVKDELESKEYDLIIAAAAPQDFKPKESFDKKLRREESITLDFVPTPSVIEGARESSPDTFSIGFKAEVDVSDEELEEVARKEMGEYDLDMIVANDVARSGAGFETDTNDVIILSESDKRHVRGTKFGIANSFLDVFVENY